MLRVVEIIRNFDVLPANQLLATAHAPTKQKRLSQAVTARAENSSDKGAPGASVEHDFLKVLRADDLALVHVEAHALAELVVAHRAH